MKNFNGTAKGLPTSDDGQPEREAWEPTTMEELYKLAWDYYVEDIDLPCIDGACAWNGCGDCVQKYLKQKKEELE